MSSKPDLIQIPPVETHLIRSKHVAQTFQIKVLQPMQRVSEKRRFPVVYSTDGNSTFDMFKDISYLLQKSQLDSPPYILVGIGYPSDCPHAGYALRIRDMTAPPWPIWEKWEKDWRECMMVEDLQGVLEAEPGTKNFHGGEDFQKFIAEELIPFIDEKYNTIKGERTYYGHSAGGFFGLYTLLKRPEVFKNYILSSPGLAVHGEPKWGGHFNNYTFGLQMVRDFVQSGGSLEGRRVYLSAATDEEFEPILAVWRITSSVLQLQKALEDAAIPGLELLTEIIPNEAHKSVWPISFTHGVQAMFGTRRVGRGVYVPSR